MNNFHMNILQIMACTLIDQLYIYTTIMCICIYTLLHHPSMCVCGVRVCVRVRTCVCTCVCIFTFVYLCVYMFTCAFVCLCVFMLVNISKNVSLIRYVTIVSTTHTYILYCIFISHRLGWKITSLL